MTFNPYHQWLGLDPRLKNPNYFQLLGVASTVSDPKLFQTQVAAAAKAKLEVLKHVEAGPHAETLEQLRKRIERAQQVLSDAKLRAAYVAKLKSELAASKITPQKKSKKNAAGVPPSSTVPSPSPVPPRAANQPRAIPTRIPVAAPQPATSPTAVPELPVPFVPSALAAAQNTPAGIPMAVPIPQQGAVPVAVATPVAGSAPSFPSADPEVGVDLPIKLRPIRKKRKSRLGQLFFAVMTLLIVGITAAGFYFIVDRLMPAKHSANGVVATEQVAGKANPDGDGPSIGNLQTLVDEMNEDGLPTEVDEGGDAHGAGSDLAKPSAENSMMPGNPIEGSNSTDVKPDQAVSNENVNSMPPASADAHVPTNMISLSDSELNGVRRQLQRIRRSLFRRDRNSATQQIAELDNRFDELLKGDRESLDALQQRLLTHLEANKHAVDLLDGFWAQVINSCVGITGGQEIEVGNQIVGFVEGADDYVVLRIAGTNIHYDYEYLAPGLAVALAEQGSIADIPTWRMQQAAFYFLYADRDNRYRDHADKLIVESVADGHDDSLLREFGNSDFSDVAPVAKLDVPDRDSMDELLSDFRSKHGYKDPRRVKANEAFEFANDLMESAFDSQEQSVAYLEEARRLAICANDAYLTEDAILELDQVSSLSAAELYLDSFFAMTRQSLAGVECRKLMETAIPVLKSTQFAPSDATKVARLKKGLFELAAKNEMVDAQRRLSQLE